MEMMMVYRSRGGLMPRLMLKWRTGILGSRWHHPGPLPGEGARPAFFSPHKLRHCSLHANPLTCFLPPERRGSTNPALPGSSTNSALPGSSSPLPSNAIVDSGLPTPEDIRPYPKAGPRKTNQQRKKMTQISNTY